MGTPFDIRDARRSARMTAIRPRAGLAETAGILRAGAAWLAGALLIACLETAVDPVHPSAEATRPLQPGAAVPSVSVVAVDGSSVDLSKLTSQSGALLVFYRGGW